MNDDNPQRGGAAAWAVLSLAAFGCFIGGVLIGLLVR